MSNKVPFHKSERMFRRYEQTIWTILKEFPNPVCIDPTPFSYNTYSCRLRDAMASVLEYKWPTSLDLTKLAEVRPHIEVCHEDGLVIIRKKGTLAALSKPNGEPKVINQADDFAFVLDKPDEAVVLAVAILLDRRVLRKPVKLTNTDPNFISTACERFDIVANADDRGYVVML